MIIQSIEHSRFSLIAGLLLALSLFPASAASETAELRAVSLPEALTQALKTNPEILTARKEIARTLGLILEVQAKAMPRVSLGAGFNDNAKAFLADRPGAIGETEAWSLSARVTQLLYSGGQVRSAVEIARLTRNSSWFQLVETINSVVARIKQQYFNIILTRELIKVQEESVSLLEQELKDQKNRFEAGTVPQFNVLRAEVELSNARPGLIAARNNFRIAQLQLARTLGIDPPVGVMGVDEPVFELTTPMEEGEWKLGMVEALAMAKLRRPLLKEQRQAILIASKTVRAEQGGYLPTVQATGGYEIRSSSTDSSWQESLEGWFAGVEGNWNIFDGLETAGKVSQARANLAKAKIGYEDAVRQVEIEVQEGYSQLQEARELIESQSKTVEQAREALRLSQARFSAGAGTQLEVFDARVALNNAQVTALQAKFEFIVAVAELERITGIAFDYASSFEDPLLKERWIRKLIAEEKAPVEATPESSK